MVKCRKHKCIVSANGGGKVTSAMGFAEDRKQAITCKNTCTGNVTNFCSAQTLLVKCQAWESYSNTFPFFSLFFSFVGITTVVARRESGKNSRQEKASNFMLNKEARKLVG